MFVCLMQLMCDGELCSTTYPPNGGEDATLFTRSELRHGAALKGWGRDNRTQRDYCPICKIEWQAARKGTSK